MKEEALKTAEKSTDYLEQAKAMAMDYGPKLIGAIVVWIIGSYIIKILSKSINKMMDKRNVDESLKPFLASLIKVSLRTLLIISVLGMLGIEMTSFIAILGAAGLAVGMALSGTLQNFAGGVIILLFKPFKVDDLIETDSYIGTVTAISIFNTHLLTPDNITVIIPNGGLSTGALKNYTTDPKRRAEWTIGISYGEDVSKARKVIEEILDKDPRILKTPAPFVGVEALADSSVNLAIHGWINPADYWDVFFWLNEEVYNSFNQANIGIPFPQMDVHIQK